MSARITREPATVFRGGGRRYLTLKAACRAEARKKVRDAYYDRGYELAEIYADERTQRVIERLARSYQRQFRVTGEDRDG